MGSRGKGVVIAERIRRCKHCGREMGVSTLAYEENPFCTNCHDERVRGAAEPGDVSWRLNGHYVEFFRKGS